jgi:hypothetical protein
LRTVIDETPVKSPVSITPIASVAVPAPAKVWLKVCVAAPGKARVASVTSVPSSTTKARSRKSRSSVANDQSKLSDWPAVTPNRWPTSEPS